jgi:hypothetical protein
VSWKESPIRSRKWTAPTATGAGTWNTYYGFDATTGAYLEFTLAMNQSFFLFDQPATMPEFTSASQMGPSSIEDVDP